MADDQDRQPTASQRFCARLGIPHPGPLSPAEKAEWDRLQDEADADLARRWGQPDPRRNAA